MYRKVTWLLSAIYFTSSVWVEGLNESMNLGYGLSLHLDETHKKNNNNSSSSLLESNSVRLNYNGIGFSVNKIQDKEVFQFDIFYNEKEEGRGKKVGEILLPSIIGMKLTGLVAMILTMTVLALKALAVSKLALVLTTGLLIAKLFFKNNKVDGYKEHTSELLQPNYLSQGTDNYLNYAINTDIIGELNDQYKSTLLPSINANSTELNNLEITRRRDGTVQHHHHHRIPQSYITLRKYFND